MPVITFLLITVLSAANPSIIKAAANSSVDVNSLNGKVITVEGRISIIGKYGMFLSNSQFNELYLGPCYIPEGTRDRLVRVKGKLLVLNPPPEREMSPEETMQQPWPIKYKLIDANGEFIYEPNEYKPISDHLGQKVTLSGIMTNAGSRGWPWIETSIGHIYIGNFDIMHSTWFSPDIVGENLKITGILQLRYKATQKFALDSNHPSELSAFNVYSMQSPTWQFCINEKENAVIRDSNVPVKVTGLIHPPSQNGYYPFMYPYLVDSNVGVIYLRDFPKTKSNEKVTLTGKLKLVYPTIHSLEEARRLNSYVLSRRNAYVLYRPD